MNVFGETSLVITAIRLEDFKSFHKQAVQLAPLTLVVGANACGKSNLLEALKLYQAVLAGYSWSDALEGKREWSGIRGGVANVGYGGAPAFCISPTWKCNGDELRHTLAIDLTPPFPRTSKEELSLERTGSPDESLYQTEPATSG